MLGKLQENSRNADLTKLTRGEDDWLIDYKRNWGSDMLDEGRGALILHGILVMVLPYVFHLRAIKPSVHFLRHRFRRQPPEMRSWNRFEDRCRRRPARFSGGRFEKQFFGQRKEDACETETHRHQLLLLFLSLALLSQIN